MPASAPPPLSSALLETPWDLSTWYPIVLLPIRLETRFFGTELRIRVYPDQIHIDSHELGLTQEERTSGIEYWSEGPNESRWQGLAQRFGVNRAAWVARVCQPHRVPSSDPNLPPELHFPDPLERAGSWTLSARARALPTRWIAVGRSTSGQLFHGTSLPIDANPVVSPDPALPSSDGTPPEEQLPLDASSRWLVDYAAAVEVGMAFAVNAPFDSTGAPETIERLLVFGVNETETPVNCAALLANLFEAHAATDGFGFVEIGTRTNNTEDAPSVGRPEPRAPSWDAPPIPSLDSGTTKLSQLFGVPLWQPNEAIPQDVLSSARREPAPVGAPTALLRARGNPQGNELRGRLIRRALWPIALEASVRHLLPVANAAELAAIREHFAHHVLPDGPLPSVRFGAQPYGILPVTALQTWTAATPQEAHAVNLLVALWRHVWLTSPIPRIRPGLENPEQTMKDILAAEGNVVELRARNVLGNDYASWLWRFQRTTPGPNWKEQLVEPARALLSLLGLGTPTDPRLSLCLYAQKSYPLTTPLLDASGSDGSVDWENVRAWLQALAAPGLLIEQIPQRPVDGAPVPVLYRLLRAALIGHHSGAAHRLAASYDPGPLGTNPLAEAYEVPEPELVDIHPAEVTNVLRRRLAHPIPNSTLTVGQYIAGPTPPGDERHAQATAELHGYRQTLLDLAEQLDPNAAPLPDPAEWERELLGTLSLFSHRLDAWLTSMASRRLEHVRAERPATLPNGVYLGAFGWVVDLHPDPPPALVPRPIDVPEDAAPALLQLSPDGAGHIHAPSLAQATTASILRSAWRAHGGGDDNPMGIDLASRRVRLALELSDGVRDGQPLGQLLGYRFERGLHEHSSGILDQYVSWFRQLAPVRVHRVDREAPELPPELTEIVESSTVVDGLELHRLYVAGRLDSALAQLPVAARTPVREVLSDLSDAIDAVGDAWLAEGVHQLAQGDFDRAAAAVDALSGAATALPDLTFVRTPNPGSTVVHRVLLLSNLRPIERLRNDWPASIREQPRIFASLNADAFFASLLPCSNRVFWSLRWRSPSGTQVTPTLEYSLDFLQASVIDYLATPARPDSPSNAELERRIEFFAWTSAKPAEVSQEWQLELDYERKPHWPIERVSLAEFLHAVHVLRDLFGQSRLIAAEDFGSEGAPIDYDLEVRNQANFAWGILRETEQQLHGAEDTQAPGWNRAAVVSQLRSAAGFGVLGAVPPPLRETTDAELAAYDERLAELGGVVARELTHRRLLHCRLIAKHRNRPPCTESDCVCRPEEFEAETLPSADARALQIARLHALFGSDLPVLSHAVIPNATDFAEALAHSVSLQGGSPHPVRRWLSRYSRVRPALARLQEALTFAEALDASGPASQFRFPLDVQVAQLPCHPDDRWVGETAPRPNTEPLSFVVITLGQLDASRPVYGLLVDEWTEVIPTAELSTGLAFEHDAPGAAAPASILVAVEAGGSTWQPAKLAQVLEETLDLAIARAVDVDSLGNAGQFLPALYFPCNVFETTTTTDFSRDTEPPTIARVESS